MSEDPNHADGANSSTTGDLGVQATAISAPYKVLGDLSNPNGGIGVIGRNTAGSGATVGVEGRVDSPDGYGLATPDDASIEGTTETPVVQSSSGTHLTLNTDGGNRTLELGVPTLDSTYTAGGNVIAGHPANSVNNSAIGVVISGGGKQAFWNSVGGNYATVGGGWDNGASGQESTIGGGTANLASGTAATVGGGELNDAGGKQSTVAGGLDNTASGTKATVAGGDSHVASGKRTFVGGGYNHEAYGLKSVIVGGNANRTGSSGTSDGTGAIIPGGFANVAEGRISYAAGQRAKARHDGAFVWADNIFADFGSGQSGTSGSPTGQDTFHVRATGGVRLVTGLNSSDDPNAGAYLSSGGSSWQSVSSARVKHDIRPVDTESVLDGVESLSISRWAYDARPGVDRMGPMAGEFSETFGLGDDEETIGHVDADGVALAAIQGLAGRLETCEDRTGDLEAAAERRDGRLDELAAENEELRRRNRELESRLETLEAELRQDSGGTRSAAD